MNDICINLDNIKVAIFDFDDTLAIHKDRDFLKHRSENEETYLNFYLNAYLNPETFIEVIACYPQERKTDAVKIIQKANNCDFSEILFVDDIKDNVDKLNNLGVCALLIDEVDSLLDIKK